MRAPSSATVMSVGTVATRSPEGSASAATTSSWAAVRAPSTTLAPSPTQRHATSRPRPVPTPVTTMVLSSNRPPMASPLCCSERPYCPDPPRRAPVGSRDVPRYAAAMGVKVAVVGGGSTYAPELAEGFCDHEDRLVVDDLVLLDPDTERLGVVGGLCRRILDRRGWGGTLRTTADRDAALEGADFVVVQLRVGERPAGCRDETLPPGYGCLGQETTGAGGLAKALRTVPVVLEIAEETAARRHPGHGWWTSPTLWGSSARPSSTRATGHSACATWPSPCSAGSAITCGSTPTRSSSNTSASTT